MQSTATSEKTERTTAAGMPRNVQESFFAPVKVQPKLTIDPIDNPYEREADSIADRVMRMTYNKDMRQPFFTPVISSLQRNCAHWEEGENKIQRKESSLEAKVGSSIESYLSSLSGGKTLSEKERSFFEPRMGYNFSNVRLHTDDIAEQSAQSINALAYTSGNNIIFDQYQPESNTGKKLLAHELTHIVQQSRGAIGSGIVLRSAISDDIQTVWDTNSTLDVLLARLSRVDVQTAQNDSDIDSTIAALLVGRPNDLWVAQRIRQGRLGATAGARPVEAHFVQGTSSQRALLIAGVHGSERQGIEVARMLLVDLAANQPVYTVIVVPSLFPDNATRGIREGTIPTNRNFPSPTEDLAAATTVGGGVPVDASIDRTGARTRSILPENIMLLQLMERFMPERIISIHGTRHSGAGGVFYDPVSLNAADVAQARRDASAMAFMQVPIEQQSTFEGQELLRLTEERNFQSMLVAMQHRDRAPALAAAAQIDAATTGINGRESRRLEREGETRVGRAERARRRAHPSVPGNVGTSGAIDTAFWSGSTPGGVSLGNYASQRGISIFTVEPPLNLRTTDYPSTLDSQVDAAERRVELQAYANAVRTVLLGR